MAPDRSTGRKQRIGPGRQGNTKPGSQEELQSHTGPTDKVYQTGAERRIKAPDRTGPDQTERILQQTRTDRTGPVLFCPEPDRTRTFGFGSMSGPVLGPVRYAVLFGANPPQNNQVKHSSKALLLYCRKRASRGPRTANSAVCFCTYTLDVHGLFLFLGQANRSAWSARKKAACIAV